jgi:hypothetical protein
MVIACLYVCTGDQLGKNPHLQSYGYYLLNRLAVIDAVISFLNSDSCGFET